MFRKNFIFPFSLMGRKAVELARMATEKIGALALIEKENRRVNAKSLLGLLSLGLKKDQEVALICDSEKDLAEMEKIIFFIQKEFEY